MSIKERRIAAGLTQQQLAELLDVNQSTVSHWEHGDKPLIKYQRKLAAILNCEVGDLRRQDHEDRKTASL